MTDFEGHTAVITGAASGLGLALCRLLASAHVRLVMVDVQQDALEAAATELRELGGVVLMQVADVSQPDEVEALGVATYTRFGAPHWVFNNAGVSVGGLIWENTPQDWAWVLGVNLMGVAHGVRVFTPMMLQAAQHDTAYRGCIINTASMAGLISAPNMGAYNVSKHAVVALTETLYHDLRLVTHQVSACVVCPDFIPTGMALSHRNRPAALSNSGPMTKSQRINRLMAARAMALASMPAADVAQAVLEGLREQRFYIFPEPSGLAAVQTRLDDVMLARAPSDPFVSRPETAHELQRALGPR